MRAILSAKYSFRRKITQLPIIIALTLGFQLSHARQNIDKISPKLSHGEIIRYLMVVDFAKKRNDYQTALDNYIFLVEKTRDPEIAEAAATYAISENKLNEALLTSKLWAHISQQNLQAQLVALSMMVTQSPDNAYPYIERAFKISPEIADQHILDILGRLDPTSRNFLSELMYRLAENNTKNADIQLAAAQVAGNLLQIDLATSYLNKVFQLRPSSTRGMELQAKLIRHSEKDDIPALEYLEKQINKYPKNDRIRMFYVMALNDNNQSYKTINHLSFLTKSKEYSSKAYIMLGEYYISENKLDESERAIKQALKDDKLEDKARYFLGQISEFKDKSKEAIDWYMGIKDPSIYHVSAYLRAASLHHINKDYQKAINVLQIASPQTFPDQKQVMLLQIDILIDAKMYEQALNLSSQALSAVPDDLDFLYARSITAGLLMQPHLAEEDLKKILNFDPNHANALNALGFTLANQPNRMSEALPYLKKALAIFPNNPAFMDSLGWLYYKQGKIQEAYNLLKDAYKISNDAEIAAHLGEVMWVSGKKQAARNLWKEALANSPKDDILLDTLSKFKLQTNEL